ncbi:MAG: hypothetical protein KF724_04770 [Phycisphaeraceae bacterium]|nr:hypothetical protein [Phycisphaeraceae bacterium]
MAVRETLERWIVGDAPESADTPSDPAPIMQRTAMELERVGDAAEALRTILIEQERERTEVLRVLQTLPEPLSALPRLAAQQESFGDMIGQALVHARQRDAQVEASLGRIVDGISQHTDVFGLIQQQLDLNLQAANGVADGTAQLTEAVQSLTASHREGTNLLAELVRRSQELGAVRERNERVQRAWMMALLGMSGLLIISALILGWMALSRLS